MRMTNMQISLILLPLFINQIHSEDSIYKVCNSLKHQTDSSDTSILTVGRLPDRVLLITTNYYLFEIPLMSLKGSANSSEMVLGSAPKRLEDEWPHLWNDSNFGHIRDNNGFFTSFTVIDKNSEYVLFTTKKSTGTFGATINIKTGELGKPYTYSGNDDLRMLSSTEKMKFYALRKGDKGLQINKWEFVGKSIFDNAKIVPNSTWYGLCSTTPVGPEELPEHVIIKTECKHEIDWAVLRGFNDGEQFYLFGPKYIHIFSDDVFERLNRKTNAIHKSYDGFFVCHADYGRIIMFLIAALLALTLLTLLLYCCCCRCRKSKKKKGEEPTKSVKNSKSRRTKSSKKSASKKSTPAVSAFGGSNAATRRSKMASKRKSKVVERSQKSKKSNYGSYANDVTGRSGFNK